MGAETYKQAFKYENLVRIAFDCPRGMRNGADLCFMQNAMTMEDGKTYAKHLGSFNKQFEKVKGYTSKALIKLSITKPYSADKDFFLDLDSKISLAGTTSELISIITIAVEKINEIKN